MIGALAALMLGGTLAAAGAAQAATPSAATPALNGRPPAGAAQTHTAGRVRAVGSAVQYSWPGIYFEGRFRGTGVGIVLDDSANDYDVAVDGATVATLVAPGRTTYWVRNLPNRVHTLRLVKRTESPWSTSAFGGLVAAPGGAVLARPAARARQIEFIGDSLTAGYGNMSAGRDCAGDQVTRTTNTDVSFGALAARRLNADYQVNAYSGLGMVRNYNGGSPGIDYRTFYDRALLNVEGDVWHNPGTWRPQLVVVDLGTNDFSTPVNAGEPWTPQTLADAYRSAYGSFIAKLRGRYGPGTMIVVVGPPLFAGKAQQVVEDRNSLGDDRVRFWPLDETSLDFLGCHWHYSAHDDRLIADRLTGFLGTLPLAW
jgi:lysophospholipase L1-like esterase